MVPFAFHLMTLGGAVQQHGDKPSAKQAPDAGAFLQVRIPPLHKSLLTRWAKPTLRSSGPSIRLLGYRTSDLNLCPSLRPLHGFLCVPFAICRTQIHAKKAWFLVRGVRGAVQARVTGSLGGEPDPAATEIGTQAPPLHIHPLTTPPRAHLLLFCSGSTVISPSAHSRVEAMHLLLRAMQAALIMVAKASEAVAGAVSAGSMMQDGGAKGTRQLLVPLSHMDVLLQLARYALRNSAP